MIVANPIGGKRLPQMSNPAAASDVAAGKQFILPDGSVGVGTGHMLTVKSGSINCDTTPADVTINTGLKSISAFILFQSYKRPSSTVMYTMALYGKGFNFCAIASDGTPHKDWTLDFSVSGGNVIIKDLYYPNTHSGLHNLPWVAVGYIE